MQTCEDTLQSVPGGQREKPGDISKHEHEFCSSTVPHMVFQISSGYANFFSFHIIIPFFLGCILYGWRRMRMRSSHPSDPSHGNSEVHGKCRICRPTVASGGVALRVIYSIRLSQPPSAISLFSLPLAFHSSSYRASCHLISASDTSGSRPRKVKPHPLGSSVSSGHFAQVQLLWISNSPGCTPRFRGTMASTSRPEPMNASPHHPKVRVTCKLSDPLYVAGGFVAGKMEVECRTDKGLGLGVIMVELFAIEGIADPRASIPVR